MDPFRKMLSLISKILCGLDFKLMIYLDYQMELDSSRSESAEGRLRVASIKLRYIYIV